MIQDQVVLPDLVGFDLWGLSMGFWVECLGWADQWWRVGQFGLTDQGVGLCLRWKYLGVRECIELFGEKVMIERFELVVWEVMVGQVNGLGTEGTGI